MSRHLSKFSTFISLAYFGILSLLYAKQPNIILIMADDVSWECFGSYGSEEYKTPHLDKMSQNGVQFNHCYSTPICTTSRVMIMTGKQNFRNYTHFGYLDPKEKTFGNLLQNAGYKTAVAGKWQLNGLYNKAPLSSDNTRPYKAGFDEYCLWQLTKGKKEGERFWSPPIEQNGKLITAEENKGKYGPDIMCDFICDFMAKHQQKPFFIYYPMLLVHSPFVVTPDTVGELSRTQERNQSVKNRKQNKQNFQDMVAYTDTIIGRILQKTEDLGIAEDTLILFTADNGTHRNISSEWNGQTIRGGKGNLTNMGTHVPLIAYQKNQLLKGKTCSDLIDFSDFYPTLAEAAHIPIEETNTLDGHSFYSQLRGEASYSRPWILSHYQPYWADRSGQFARTKDFKLYSDGRFYQPENDLQETRELSTSLADKPNLKTIYESLQAILDQAPPAPKEAGNKTIKERPTYPNWKKL